MPPVVVAPPPAPDGRPPPHDLDAEAAVLSACLLDTAAVARVLELLTPEHFYSEANARIFQAIQQLAIANGPVDIVAVAAWLRDRDWLARMGGTAYLAQLADATPAVGHVTTHAKIVSRKFRRRRAIARAQLIAAEGYDDCGDEDEWLDGLGSRMASAAADDAGTGGPVSLGDAMKQTFADLHRGTPGEITGYSTGLPRLDALTGGLHGGEVVLLKAKKKTGKSVLCGQLASTIANRPTPRRTGDPRCTTCLAAVLPCTCERCAAGTPCGRKEKAAGAPCDRHAYQRRGGLILALEGKVRDWSTRLACAHGRVDANLVRVGQAGPDDMVRMARAAEHLAQLPIRIDDRKDLNVAKLGIRVRAVRDQMAEKGVVLSCVVLDNIQLWDDPDDRRDRRLVLDTAMRGLMNLAAAPDLGEVAWIVVSQVNADGAARDSGAALEAHADAIWGLSVDEDEELDGGHAARVNVEVQRRGPPGKAPFWFYPRWTLFWDGG